MAGSSGSSGRGKLLRSLGQLKGNTRVCTVMQPMWGIPYTLYHFYLSLYMKSLGVTDRQLGFLISLSYLAGFVVSLFAGMVVDALGRRKTTLIFDFLAWPVMIALFAVSREFWHFAAAVVVGNAALRIVGISWTLILVEDAGSEERVAAYNLIHVINIAVGILTPAAGLLVRNFGVIAGGRVLLAFAAISMSTMFLIRHRMLRETRIGRRILAERRRYGRAASGGVAVFYGRNLAYLRARPRTKWVLAAVVLFNTFAAFGSFNSLYYAPYLTEALRLEKSAISLLGGVNAAVLLAVLVFLAPAVISARRRSAMFCGLGLQAAGLVMFIVIPGASLYWAGAAVIVFAVGFGLFRPFLDPLLAEATEGKERAGLYSLNYLAVTSLGATMGAVSGYLYHCRPALLYLLSLGILAACGVALWLGSEKTAAGREAVNAVVGQ